MATGGLHGKGDRLVTVVAAGRGAPASPRGGLTDIGIAGGGHDRRERAHPRGCSIAIVCTIIPPIDAPTMCAQVDAEVIEHADAVGSHVGEQVGRLDRWP